MKLRKCIGVFAIVGIMSSTLATSVFAAEVPVEMASNKLELGEYMETLSTNRITLEQLMNGNSKLFNKINVLENELKQLDVLTDDDSTTIHEMSADIQQQRLELTEKRNAVMELQTTGQTSIESGNIEDAKAAIEQVITIQSEQISIQDGLTKLLTEKLDYLSALSSDNSTEANQV